MKRVFKILLLVLISVVAVSSVLFYRYFISMAALPGGEKLGTCQQSETNRAVNIYRCNGGATADYAIRGEVAFEDGRTKTIYWSYHEDSADVKWLDSETVSINGHVLNIYKDKYDWRRQ